MPDGPSQGVLEAFRTHLEQQDLQPSTVRRYLATAARWLGTGQDPVTWLRATLPPDCPTGTLCSYRAPVKAWLEWKGGVIPKPLVPGLDGRTSQKMRPEALTVEELGVFRELLVASDIPEPSRTIIALLPYTGLRISEACSLTQRGLRRRGNGYALSVVGKRNKTRVIPISPQAARVLRDYRARAGLVEGTWLFPSPQDAARHVTPNTVQKHIARLREGQKGRLGRVTAHWLRHTYATLALADGHDLKALQTMLGHSSLETTGIYTEPTWESLEALSRSVDKKRR